MIKGWIYKELRQSWPYLITIIFLSLMPVINLSLFGWTFDDTGSYRIFYFIETLVMIAGAGFIHMMMLKGDERKSFGYFTVSTSGGRQAFLFVKYGLILAMHILFFTGYSIAVYSSDMYGFVTVQRVWHALIPVLCVQLIVRAIDIPFVYRFGSQKGNTIKVICMILLAFVMIFMMAVTDDFEKILNAGRLVFRKIETVRVWPFFIICSVFIYYLSYRITCRLYLKGVEHYGE